MRTIEDKILDRLNGESKGEWNLSCRDKVNVKETIREYYLWSNRIYFRKNGVEHFCFCNWSSQTTKSRLNALVRRGSFYQKNWEIYFILHSNNKTYLIDTSKVYAISTISNCLLEYNSYKETYKEVEEI